MNTRLKILKMKVDLAYSWVLVFFLRVRSNLTLLFEVVLFFLHFIAGFVKDLQ